jgi:ATP-binding cassette, subfamily B, multidrug efflux pump
MPQATRGRALFRFFENLVDPYTPYQETDTPPQRLWPFLRDYAQPFRLVFVAATAAKVLVALMEVALIWYVGRLIDLLAQGAPGDVLTRHGVELALAALFVLVARPAIAACDTLLLHNAVLPNFGTLIRWRAHRHVLRQSVGWFENDFAGPHRQPDHADPARRGRGRVPGVRRGGVLGVLHSGRHGHAGWRDPRLVLPLLVWVAGYIGLVRWTIRNAGPAAKASSDARSAMTGRVVDSYTNIHAVKMFAHHDREVEPMRRRRSRNRGAPSSMKCGSFTKMDVA